VVCEKEFINRVEHVEKLKEEIKKMCEEFKRTSPKPKASAFISHCGDYDFVFRLCKKLFENQILPIIYFVNPALGKNLDEDIGERIWGSDFFIAIIGECTKNTHYVDNEVGYAFSLVHKGHMKHTYSVIPIFTSQQLFDEYWGFYSHKNIAIILNEKNWEEKISDIIRHIDSHTTEGKGRVVLLKGLENY
jgi:hypothetical protein